MGSPQKAVSWKLFCVVVFFVWVPFWSPSKCIRGRGTLDSTDRVRLFFGIVLLKLQENGSMGQLCVIDSSNKDFNIPRMKDTLKLGNFSISFSDSVYPKVCYLSLMIIPWHRDHPWSSPPIHCPVQTWRSTDLDSEPGSVLPENLVWALFLFFIDFWMNKP